MLTLDKRQTKVYTYCKGNASIVIAVRAKALLCGLGHTREKL